MEKLLQEIIDFENHKDCLSPVLERIYEQDLKKRFSQKLEETTIENLEDIFKNIFNQDETSTSKATVNEINRVVKAIQQTKYERKFGKVIPNSRTNLEITLGNYCNKKRFKREFEKIDFSEFEIRKIYRSTML